MGLKRLFKLLFWNNLQQLHYQTVFRLKGIKQGCSIDKGLYAYNLEFVTLGKNIKLKKNWRIECYPSFCGKKLTPQLKIGDNSIINFGFTAFVADKIVIGQNCIFAANVTLISENHGTDPESSKPYYAQDLTTGPIVIGEGTWLGQNVSVLPNVTIGEKVVVATNAVVTHDIPAYSIAAGIPARVIKQYDMNEKKWRNVQ